MSLTSKDVAEILRLLEESSFDELTLESGELKLTLRRGAAGAEEAPRPAPAARPAAPEPRAALAAAISTTSPFTPARTEFISFITSMMAMTVSSSTVWPTSTNGGSPGLGAR